MSVDNDGDCNHARFYELTSSKYLLCLDCGEHIPMESQ
jgi:hypothetical protein